MDFLFGNIEIQNVNSNVVPNGLEIKYDTNLNPYDQVKVEETVEYWLSAKAITDGTYKTMWVTENTLMVQANFGKGHFKGDLTHRNALTYGDKSFKIGLGLLFYTGYYPKTQQGNGIHDALIPQYIKCY